MTKIAGNEIITVESMILTKAEGNLKAHAWVNIMNLYKVQVKVVLGKNGLFVAHPQKKNNNPKPNQKEYSMLGYPVNGYSTIFENAVLESYKATVREQESMKNDK